MPKEPIVKRPGLREKLGQAMEARRAKAAAWKAREKDKFEEVLAQRAAEKASAEKARQELVTNANTAAKLNFFVDACNARHIPDPRKYFAENYAKLEGNKKYVYLEVAVKGRLLEMAIRAGRIKDAQGNAQKDPRVFWENVGKQKRDAKKPFKINFEKFGFNETIYYASLMAAELAGKKINLERLENTILKRMIEHAKAKKAGKGGEYRLTP